MGVVKCPKCGGTHCQPSTEVSKQGCLKYIIFGVFYLIWVMFKWMIGLFYLVLFDWWIAIIKNRQGKGYVWKSAGFFKTTKTRYYCHDCGNSFRA